ncbi:ribosomal protein S6 kinase alpha-6-like [Galendromus occidentalis]|uniref:Serine/threonine-protein kinase greatwall n=1 Tax=Galendromus occidentalis TaxID=34638 RepID=A0AAJ7L7L7_9ACAR|nr:ribosomal protein S6 kinase alpha-6-like [Galendromus occidentalis]
MRRSASDDSEPLVPAPKKVRRAIKILADKNPALLEAPIAFLNLYTQEFESSKCLDRSPPLQYCLRQCFLGFQDVCRQIQKRTLKAVILRENIMNLVSLGNTVGKSYPETAEPVCAQLVKLIAMLDELDRQLADASGLPPVNWSSIVSALKQRSAMKRKSSEVKHKTSFVPSLDDLTVTKTLGRGAFGAVYKGTFKDILEVAIKIVPQSKLRFDSNNESAYIDKMLAAVVPNHPFICRMFCAFMASGKANPSGVAVSINVMEAIDGADITELVTRVQAPSFSTVMSITQQLLMAIEHMHFTGFVHRDIKLANILLSRDGRVKVIDFDVNKLCIALSGTQHQISFFARTAAECAGGDKAGTEAYMAPEVHQCKEFGRASDFWSVGVVLFRLAFGRLPFRGQAIAEEIVDCDIEWTRIKNLPPATPKKSGLKELISQLLVKDPKKRLGSRDYNDIFDHRTFAETNWRSLPSSVALTEDMENLFAAKDRESRVVAKAPPAHSQIFALEDLVDYAGEHQKLFTFSSRVIRHLMSETGGHSRDFDEGKEIKDDTLSFRHCQQLVKQAEDTTCGTTTFDDRKHNAREPVQVIIQEFYRKSCLRRVPPLAVQRLLCEDGMYRFMVASIAPGVKFLSETALYQGDLLLELDRIPLTGLPLGRIQTLLLKVGSPLVATVAQRNPFRDLGEATLNVENYANVHRAIVLNFRSRRKRRVGCFCRRRHYHGFELCVRKLFANENWEPCCLVSSHDLIWQKCGEDSNMFTGDIVLSINQKRLAELLRDAKADQILSDAIDSPRLDLEIVPCSVLRLGNLPRG